MIDFKYDQRMDDSWVSEAQKNNIESALAKLMNNQIVKDMLVGQNYTVLVTTILPDNSPVPLHHTGIGSPEVARDELGYNYSIVPTTELGVVGYNKILLVSPSLIGGLDVPGFSGTGHMSLTRILFHELVHLTTFFGVKDGGSRFNEELAVFQENLTYRAIAASLGENDTFIRYAHDGQAFDGTGVSGINSFQRYVTSTSAYFSLDRANTNADITTFIAGDASYSLVKTYHNLGYAVGEQSYNHYITLTEEKTIGSYVTATASSFYTDSRLSVVAGDIMGGDKITAGLSSAVDAWRLVAKIGPSYAMEYGRVTGVGADAFADDGVRYFGPISLSDLDHAIIVDDTSATSSTILIGSSGSFTPYTLKAGGENNIVISGGKASNTLYGNMKHDILIGGEGNDELYGEGDDDILIGGGGANRLDGGAGNDAAYYGDRPQGIIVNDVQGHVTHDNVVDKITSIERFIGTKQRDEFTAAGQNHVFYGNGGNDTFFAADGADRFVGNTTLGSTNGDTVNFSKTAMGVDLIMSGSIFGSGTTTAGHEFSGVSNIVGANFENKFDITSLSGNITVHGGGKADEFIMAGGVIAYGESGNDIFKMAGNSQRAYGGTGSDRFLITKNASNILIDGGSGDEDIDVLDFSLYPGEARVNLSNNTFTGAWGINSFIGIEKFYFGKNAMQMNGSPYADVMDTGSTKSILNGGEGEDFLTVTAVDEFTPADHTRSDVTVNGGAGIDYIYAHRAATLNGDVGDDFIWGSNESDLIRGGAGNDIIDARGGDDLFDEMPNGVDYIDAGDGIDTYSSNNRVSAFDFFLTGEDLEGLGIQNAGSTSGQLLFQNLEKLKFFASYTADDRIDVSKAIEVLQADDDHFMTGAQLKTAIAASSAHRAMSDQAAEDPGFWFAPETDPSENDYMSAAFTPDHNVRYDTYDTDAGEWAMQVAVYQAPMHNDWFFM